ncbi:MFS transporter [Grimontia marina]|uniref:Enterobactin exporter EntS n=1 Tax=Grimontia marina TaxID=646534 RepID=A0A128F1G1_9GAMM|nr:MFS transporter [Grimontia marina]CZF80086.1 enterobactin exporter EntS [Grimontia marina]
MLSNRFIVAGGLFSSQFATGSLSFAISLYLLDATQSALLFSMAVGASFVPSVVISLLSGVWVDKWNKKRVVCLCDFCTGLIALAFVLTVSYADNLNTLLFYIVCVASVQALLTLAFNSALPELFPADVLPSANGLVQSVSAVTRIVAPISGALLYANISLNLIFIISGAIYFVSAVAQLNLRFTEKKSEESTINKDYISAQREAFDYVKQHPSIRFFLVFEILLNGLYLPLVLVAMPFIIYQVLGVSPLQLSLVEASMAIGTIIGALIASKKAVQKTAIRYFCLLLIPQALLILVWLFPFPQQANAMLITSFFAATFVVLACLNTVQNIPVLSQFQRTVPQHMLGRLFGLFFALLNLAVPAGIWLVGSLLTAENWHQVIVFSAALMVLLGIFGNRNKGFHAFVNDESPATKEYATTPEH